MPSTLFRLTPTILAALVAACVSTLPERPSPPGGGVPEPSSGSRGLPPSLDDALETELIAADLVAHRIQDQAWVITHERPLSANSLVVRGSGGEVLLVDTPWTPRATEALLEWIRETLEPASIVAVNTHFHLDALGGNAALREAGVQATGLVVTADLLRERGRQRLEELVRSLEDPAQQGELQAVELIPPSSLYMASRYGLPLGEERFELIFPGPGHSPDNLAVYFPARRLLFGGCMVKAGSSLGFLGDTNLARWPAAIRELQKLDVEMVVPGHGKRLDPGLLEHTLGLLEKGS